MRKSSIILFLFNHLKWNWALNWTSSSSRSISDLWPFDIAIAGGGLRARLQKVSISIFEQLTWREKSHLTVKDRCECRRSSSICLQCKAINSYIHEKEGKKGRILKIQPLVLAIWHSLGLEIELYVTSSEICEKGCNYLLRVPKSIKLHTYES